MIIFELENKFDANNKSLLNKNKQKITKKINAGTHKKKGLTKNNLFICCLLRIISV